MAAWDFNSGAHMGRNSIFRNRLPAKQNFNSGAHMGRNYMGRCSMALISAFQLRCPHRGTTAKQISISVPLTISTQIPRGAQLPAPLLQAHLHHISTQVPHGAQRLLTAPIWTLFRFQLIRPHGALRCGALDKIANRVFQLRRPHWAQRSGHGTRLTTT